MFGYLYKTKEKEEEEEVLTEIIVVLKFVRGTREYVKLGAVGKDIYGGRQCTR